MRSMIPTLCALTLTALLAPTATADSTTANNATAEPAAAGSTVVKIAAPDGVQLAATYTSPGKPGPGVMLLHMCNSDRSAWTGLADQLAARGIHSLAVDYRGYGDSGGDRGEGPEGRRTRAELWPGDIDAAFEFLRSRPGVNQARIGAGGGSCGVDQSIDLARRHPGKVTSLVLLAGSVGDEGTTFLAENPWLPIFGSASLDDGQAVSSMRWLLGFSSHPDNRFVEYAHGGHGTEMFAVHDDLEPTIVEWFEKHLIESPIHKPEKVTAAPGPSQQIWQELVTPGGVARLAEKLKASQNVVLPPESAINAEGYRLIGAGETQRAIELLAFNTKAFPRSANALDSLGDAYLADGQPEKAADFARQAIAAIPGDSSISEDFARAVRESAESKLEAGAKDGDG